MSTIFKDETEEKILFILRERAQEACQPGEIVQETCETAFFKD